MNDIIIKGENGEPDGILQQPVSCLKSSTKPYARFDLETGQGILSQLPAPCFVIWLACLNQYRIKKGHAFHLGTNLRKMWSISSSRLTQYLEKLQKAGLVKFTIESGKSPLINFVSEELSNNLDQT